MRDGGARRAVSARLPRRTLVAALASMMAGVTGAVPTKAQTFDDPPAFRTGHQQFTILDPPQTLPAVTLVDLTGKKATLAHPPGKILLIGIWATWCPACRVDLPMLDRFEVAMRGRVDVAAVCVDKIGPRSVAAFVQSLGVHDLAIYLDPEGRLASDDAGGGASLPLYSFPVTFLITPSGRVAGYIAGTNDWLSGDAQTLLAYYAAA